MSNIVETSAGPVEGEQLGGHVAFRGIPYARAPLGELRFRAPEPPEPWSSVRAARAFSPAALQGAAFAPGVTAETTQSEDCLYLNVFTPAADGQQRPVMVWVHGGAFTVGSAGMPLYDGRALAERHGVVLVTLNYRLGAVGYLALGDEGARFGAVDNRGQLDQIAALEWVRDNIAGFGGDPRNVTVFGESAGGAAVALLLATPRAEGLFRRAILQSSTAPLLLRGPDDHAKTRRMMLEKLGLAELGELARVPAEALLRAQAEVETRLPWPHFYPVLDGALYPEQPAAILRSGRGSRVPCIIGTNRDEWNLFAIMSPVFRAPLEEAALLAQVSARLPHASRAAAGELVETYRASRRARGLLHDNRSLLWAITGDLAFRIPSVRLAELAIALDMPTHVYLLTHESPALGGVLGSCHALELPLVFGTFAQPAQERFVGGGEEVAALSRAMMALWTSFAATGTPTAEGLGGWPTYDLARRDTLELATPVRVVADPYGDERRAWDGVL